MPDMAYAFVFMENDLTHITEDHFEIKLVARLLDQMYVVQPSMFPPRYDDASPQDMNIHNHIRVQLVQGHQHLSSQNICICYLPAHKHRVWLHDKNLLFIAFMIAMI